MVRSRSKAVPRKTTVKEFPFLEGQHQEIDAKVLPDGYLSACKNVRLRKDGRFGVRADFDALGNDTATSIDVAPRDLVSFGDALCAFVAPSNITGDTTLWDIADYTRQTPAEWKPSSLSASNPLDTRLPTVTNVRMLSGAPAIGGATSVTRMDCAAAGGIVGLAFEQSAGSASLIQFFRASDGASVLSTVLNGGAPRIVSVGTTFFFTATAGGNILLAKYDPTTDADKTDLTNITASSNGIYDLVTNRAGTGFWVAFNTAGPTTSLVPYNSSGVAGAAITGPAVLYDYVAIRETLTRVHLVSVLAAGTVELRSYTLAGALSTGPTTLAATSDRQPGIADATYSGTEAVLVAIEETASPNDVAWTITNALTHAAIFGPVTIADTFLGAKPISGGSTNYHYLVGGIAPDGSFFSSFLQCASRSGVFTVGAYTNKFGATKPAINHTPQIAKDASTGKCYWPTLTVADAGIARPQIAEFDFPSTARRQTAQMAGILYIGGGAVEAYDGRGVVSVGYFEKPRIVSATPSNGAGSLPSGVTLLVALVREERDALGNLVESDISDVSSVVMGGADDTVTLVTTTPHGQRAVSGTLDVAHRSTSGINQLRRAENSTSVGATITLLASDATVRANGVIYTQSGRAALGAILPHEAPPPADFLWKFGSRLLAASADQAFVSKEIFPGRQVEWSGAVGFTIPKISERITGCAALDQRGFLFTSERIYQFSGDGPNDAGEGRYSEPSVVPGSTGLLTWQSLVETPLGLLFQGSNGQLWLLPRDGSPPSWIGQAVRDVLVSFPTVTAAVLLVKEQLVSFTCNNSGATDARVVSYDLRAKTWIVDEFTSSTPITSACSYQGRLAYLSSGVVYTEKTSLTPATFIEHSVTTGTVKPFDWGKICGIELLGEYRGDCNLRCRISYDDGKTYTNLATHQLRSTEFAVGDTVERTWAPLRRKCDSFKLDFQALTPGSASEGLVFNAFRIEYMPERGAARRASGQRG